eukprot:8069638-Alexandrium_andersonii.AAC.1
MACSPRSRANAPCFSLPRPRSNRTLRGSAHSCTCGPGDVSSWGPMGCSGDSRRATVTFS